MTKPLLQIVTARLIVPKLQFYEFGKKKREMWFSVVSYLLLDGKRLSVHTYACSLVSHTSAAEMVSSFTPTSDARDNSDSS